jgi:hypothetical protein
MGQRHQIYVKFPGFSKAETKKTANPTNGEGIAGFHHQWLYGMTAINSLARLVEFYKNSDKYSPLKINTGYGLKRQSEVVRAIYSVDLKTGYWHYVHNFLDGQDDYAEREDCHKPPSEIIDPRMGDNNDGITIVDLSHGDFRYCFMSLHGLECGGKVKELSPLSAKEYLFSYYPDFNKGHRNMEIEKKEWLIACDSLALIEKETKILTLSEVKKMFPAMFKKERAASEPRGG